MPKLSIWVFVYVVLHIAVLARALVVEGKEPASRAAWVLILLFLPGVGIAAYVLFGEPWVSRRSRRRATAAGTHLSDRIVVPDVAALDAVPACYHPAFQVCAHLAGTGVTGGNQAMLTAGSNAAIDAMVRDFDAACETIHVSFYIWLTDINGVKVVDALRRAAARGITCRVIADGVGSRELIRSHHWRAMKAAGVKLCTSMKVSFGLAAVLGSRVDLRNHRKIVVVDGRVTYCGSQNCADPEFRIKAKYAPWVDIMLRFEGPVARQNQLLFAGDWMAETREDISAQLEPPVPPPEAAGVTAIAFGTGPLSVPDAMSDAFVSILYCARDEAVISNPYFVPGPPLLSALASCARRGVRTTLIVPERNDSRLVSAISKAYYARLLEAGVRLCEFRDGLLHAKTLVVDSALALVGSANMDRRSLELNFENNILLYSPQLAGAIRARQDDWLARSRELRADVVMHRPLLRRIGDNVLAIFSPIM